MVTISRDTYKRPADMHDTSDPAVLYVRSYLTIRTAVGLLGASLPILLWIVDGLTWPVRGSLSAYYHSPALDVFVAVLSIIAFLLITYMSGKPDSWDFIMSTIAGVALLGVVFFPTARDEAVAAGVSCGATNPTGGCSAIERAVGEVRTSQIHTACAVVFIALLALISLGFARREAKYNQNGVAAGFHQAMAGLIALMLAGSAFAHFVDSMDIWQFTMVYATELVSVWAFSLSWLLKGWDLRPLIRSPGRVVGSKLTGSGGSHGSGPDDAGPDPGGHRPGEPAPADEATPPDKSARADKPEPVPAQSGPDPA